MGGFEASAVRAMARLEKPRSRASLTCDTALYATRSAQPRCTHVTRVVQTLPAQAEHPCAHIHLRGGLRALANTASKRGVTATLLRARFAAQRINAPEHLQRQKMSPAIDDIEAPAIRPPEHPPLATTNPLLVNALREGKVDEAALRKLPRRNAAPRRARHRPGATRSTRGGPGRRPGLRPPRLGGVARRRAPRKALPRPRPRLEPRSPVP